MLMLPLLLLLVALHRGVRVDRDAGRIFWGNASTLAACERNLRVLLFVEVFCFLRVEEEAGAVLGVVP